MKAPADCNSMAELRVQIDLLDEQLVQMLAFRAAYIDRAAELKPAEGLPARIGPRVEEVVANAVKKAERLRLDPALVETLWRAMVDWSIAREEKTLGQDGPLKE